jgi:DNA-binding transcriptional ArsR family regulator
MLQVFFTSEDLARTRVFVPADPAVETLFAAQFLARRAHSSLFELWQAGILGKCDSSIRSITSSPRVPRPTTELFVRSGGKAGPARPHTMSSGECGPEWSVAIRRFHQVAIAPYWKRVRSCLAAERAARGRILLEEGVHGLLSSLHPAAAWEAPRLSIHGPADQEVRLGGQGLLIVPSLFMRDRLEVFLPAPRTDGPPVLVYPMPIDVPTANTLWTMSTHKEEALMALVGRTRAMLLWTLNESSTTTGLSTKLSVSPAAISQHTAVLRTAGLISTRRDGNRVWHSLTPLGSDLLDSLSRSA